MTITEQYKKMVEEYDNYHARCIATDGEYTYEEMAKISSDAIKMNYEWNRNLLTQSILSLLKAEVDALEGMKKKQGRIARKGQFETVLIAEVRAYNQALQDRKQILEERIREI